MDLLELNRKVFNLMEDVRRDFNEHGKIFYYTFRIASLSNKENNILRNVENGYFFVGNRDKNVIVRFGKREKSPWDYSLKFTTDGKFNFSTPRNKYKRKKAYTKKAVIDEIEKVISDNDWNSFFEVIEDDYKKTIKTLIDNEQIRKNPDYPNYFIAVDPNNPIPIINNPVITDIAKEDVGNGEKGENGNTEKLPLNLILYGPPGTGKTHCTVDKALERLLPKHELDSLNAITPKDDKRKAQEEKFNELKKQGRIVFTTFHQSMSYEDFIEGIKPETDDDGNVTYEVKPGIFKQLCEKAKLSQTSSNFNEAYNTFINDLTSAGYYGNNPSKFVTSNKSTFGISVNSKGNLSLFTGNPLKKQGTITKDNLELRFLGNSNYNYWESYFKRIIEHLEDRYQLQQENRPNNNNYVLIIDEINRGNVANIFGELITLIEDDKRGKLSVKLPYSNEDFSVPKNLYIIGTMNTADRSVEALDTALRRRFSFEEMMPDTALLNKYKVMNGTDKLCTFKDILDTINSRIEVLKDRDHLIGHSYFMIKVKDDQGNEIDKESFNLNDENDKKMLISIFFDKIIPLLQEYFYGDYEKIQMVLGNGFVNNKKPDVIFAGNKTFDELQEQSYSIVDFDRNKPNTFDLTNALALMMNKYTKEELDTQGNGES